MQASKVKEYIDQIPEERKEAYLKIRQTILDNLPEGFAEEMSYGMPGFVVPHSIYPAGYHCKPEEPLPFISLASRKNFIALYHMGIYSDEKLLNWFREEYGKACRTKLDMGKSCIRLKKMDDIPYKLIGDLASKMTVDQWIDIYESSVKK
ncbi:MAG: DUF1801 domain-containing protein [Spirochaetales bacterium]|nr:DUF1801 domain-containing protein [Spirochaetales bacterium]